jgi:hypothetical protein
VPVNLRIRIARTLEESFTCNANTYIVVVPYPVPLK